MASPLENRWADDVDDEDDFSLHEPKASSGGITIPPTHTSRVDSKGIKIVTSYRADPSNPNNLLKTITKIRVNSVTVKEHVDVEKRRKWKKFGQAAIDDKEGNTNVTIQSRDDVYLEDPHADTDLKDEDVAKTIAGNLNQFWAKQQKRQLERQYDVEGPDSAQQKDSDAADGWQTVGASAGGGGNVYVPPSARAAAAGGGVGIRATGGLAALAERAGEKSSMDTNRDQTTIRVTNISEETTELDLQQLFERFGRISRVYLAKDKTTLVSRGFAFVSFVHKEDAERAMEKLQGYGYDHLILKLEWAKPTGPKNPGSEGTQYRSGYGKALAQDTKEKVSYASNLTR